MTTIRTIARLGFACAIATTATLAPAWAEEGVAIKNLLGAVGITSPEKDAIAYRERAPLVLPPKMQLREPAGKVNTAAANPQWPKDPDVEAKQRLSAEQRRPVTESEVRRLADRNPRLSIDEIRAGRASTSTASVEPKVHRGDNARDALLLSPDELMRTAKSDDAEDAKLAEGEPLRKSLAEPPSGFRKSAMGVAINGPRSIPKGDQQSIDANPVSWFTQKFASPDND